MGISTMKAKKPPNRKPLKPRKNVTKVNRGAGAIRKYLVGSYSEDPGDLSHPEDQKSNGVLPEFLRINVTLVPFIGSFLD